MDFINHAEVIRESFQRFYTSTALEGEPDPNTMYDTISAIEIYRLYTRQEVDEFCKVFFNLNRDESELHAILDRVVDRYQAMQDKDGQEEFKSKIQK